MSKIEHAVENGERATARQTLCLLKALDAIGANVTSPVNGDVLNKIFQQLEERQVLIPSGRFERMAKRKQDALCQELRSLNLTINTKSGVMSSQVKDPDDYKTWSDEELKTQAITERGNNRRLDKNSWTADEAVQFRISQHHKNGTFSKSVFKDWRPNLY